MTCLRSFYLCFTAFAVMAAAPPAWADASSEALVQDFIAGIDASLAWDASVESISSSEADTLITGLRISQTDGPFRLRAGAVSLRELAANSGGGFSAAQISIRDTSIGLPDLTINVPALKADSFFTPGLGDWRFDAVRPAASLAALATRITQTEFAQIYVPSAAVDLPGAAGAITTSATISAVNYQGMKAGRLASMSVGKVEAVAVGPFGVPLTVLWEGMTASNIDAGAIARVLDPQAYPDGRGDGLWTLAAEAVRYGGLAMSAGSNKLFALGGVDLSDIDVRQPDRPIANAADQLAAAGFDLVQDEAWTFVSKEGASLTSWLRLGALTVRGVRLTPPGGGEVSGQSLSIEDLSPDGLGRMALEGLVVNPPNLEIDPSLTIRHAEIGAVQWPRLTTLLAIARELDRPRGFANLNVTEQEQLVAAFLDLIPVIGHFTIAGADFALPRSSAMTLDSLHYKAAGPYTGPLPAVGEFAVEGLKIPATVLTQSAGLDLKLEELGYSEAGIGIKLTGSLDGQTGAILTHAFSQHERRGRGDS